MVKIDNPPWALMAKTKGTNKTASGPIVSINDAQAAPLRSLLVNIDPVQEGTGDPSPDNVRPISGWDGMTVYHSGADTSDPSTYPITWQSAGTVYGGTLDVLSGVLTVDAMVNEYDGTEDWASYSGATHSFYLNIGVGSDRPIDPNRDGIMSYAKRNNTSPANAPDWVFTVQGGQRLVITTESDIDTIAKWKTYLSNNHLQYLMPLVTPHHHPLTPQQISSLVGENNVRADTGDVTVEYKSNTPDKSLMKLAVAFMNRR